MPCKFYGYGSCEFFLRRNAYKLFLFFDWIFKGVYPDCQCQQEGHVFSAFINECYAKCPNTSSGIHPTCRCDSIDDYYVADELICKSKVGRKCPIATIGIGPECLCMRKHFKFDSIQWDCYHKDTWVKTFNKRHDYYWIKFFSLKIFRTSRNQLLPWCWEVATVSFVDWSQCAFKLSWLSFNESDCNIYSYE